MIKQFDSNEFLLDKNKSRAHFEKLKGNVLYFHSTCVAFTCVAFSKNYSICYYSIEKF
jgi:hypothetical protein